MSTPFPPHLRGRVIEGVEMILLDADIAGCVRSSMPGPLDEKLREILLLCLAEVDKALPLLDDEVGAIEYYEHLRDMAALAVEIANARVL